MSTKDSKDTIIFSDIVDDNKCENDDVGGGGGGIPSDSEDHISSQMSALIHGWYIVLLAKERGNTRAERTIIQVTGHIYKLLRHVETCSHKRRELKYSDHLVLQSLPDRLFSHIIRGSALQMITYHQRQYNKNIKYLQPMEQSVEMTNHEKLKYELMKSVWLPNRMGIGVGICGQCSSLPSSSSGLWKVVQVIGPIMTHDESLVIECLWSKSLRGIIAKVARGMAIAKTFGIKTYIDWNIVFSRKKYIM